MYLTQGLHRAAQHSPSKPATVFAGNTRTFGELKNRVARGSALLREFHVCAGDRVAILGHNSDLYVELLLAIWWAGAIAVPVNARWSPSEIKCSLSDCGCALLFYEDGFEAVFELLRGNSDAMLRMVRIRAGTIPSDFSTYERLSERCAPISDKRTEGDQVAAILYTGGTTGRPKGVILSHANLWCAAVTRSADTRATADSVALLVSPLFHVSGLLRLVSQLMLGATSVIEPLFRPEAILRAIESHCVTDVVVVPSMLQMLLDYPSFDGARMRTLRRISFGGAPMPPALLNRAMDTLPSVGFSSSYGMTETASVVSVFGPVAREDQLSAGTELRSVGRPGLGIELRIVDAQGTDLPSGSVGEVLLRGPSITQGYWNKPVETAAALRGGWLHTGDAGWQDEAGYLYVVDRLKDMVITGGENVYSAEVEAALMTHAAVANCAVIGVANFQWGESVHAVVILRPGITISADDLKKHCRIHLAGYKCPRSVEFAASLPMSAAGKVLKNRLREDFGARVSIDGK
jgi:long-chain acyl-CoA synthetase